jgi:hypothetical protein
MTADSSQVIVTTGSTAHAVQVYHRDIPELRADGESPELAAVNLAQDLAREIESVADNLRREAVQRALADVRAFIKQPPRSGFAVPHQSEVSPPERGT